MITSDQIHEKVFTFKIRGYNDAEVDAYLDQLAAYIDNLSKENKDLRERLKSTTDQLTYMKNLESTLRDTLVTAQRSAEETTSSANAQADEILRRANQEAARIVAQANNEAENVRRQLGSLHQQAANYRQSFRMLLNSQMQLLEESGLGKEKNEEAAAPVVRSASMPRIDLAQERENERRMQEQSPRKIVPIPQEDD